MIPTRIQLNRPIPPLTYLAPEGLEPGLRVRVPLRTGSAVGIVVGPDLHPIPGMKLKAVHEIIDPFRLVPDEVWNLMQFASHYYGCHEAALLSLSISNTVRARWDEPYEPGNTLAMLRDTGEFTVLAALGKKWRAGTLILSTLFHRQTTRGRGTTEIHRTDLLPEGRTTPQQKKVLARLEESSGILDEETLLAEAGVGPSVLSTLEEKNLIFKLKGIEGLSQVRSAQADVSVTLTEEQLKVKQSITLGSFKPYVLHGVTGSGKTEVYLSCARDVISQGKKVLWLVPEIGLTPRLLSRLEGAFPGYVGVGHAGLNSGERQADMIRALQGHIKLFVGVRNAVLAPIADLGLIIVDEEHEGSYKSEEYPRLHARDLAIKRAQLAQCPIILGSATPSLESWVATQDNRYTLLTLQNRPLGSTLPRVTVVDLREEYRQHRKRVVFSSTLLDAMNHTLGGGEQALLLLNRRGYENFWLCRACGKTIDCHHCSISLTYHQKSYKLRCHLCDYASAPPEVCPFCGAEHLKGVGEGTEQIEEMLKLQFPSARVLRIDRDTTSRRGEMEKRLLQVERGDIDIVVGTQMIAKGHNFPKLTLVGILNADQGLKTPDFRAAERTFQLLTQVAGRAGRADNPGHVIFQTYSPDHHAILSASRQDFIEFSQVEIPYRRSVAYPPFFALALYRSVAATPEEAQGPLRIIKERLKDQEDIRVLGPIQAPIFKIQDHYHMQLLVRANNRQALSNALRVIVLADFKEVSLDRDPYHFS